MNIPIFSGPGCPIYVRKGSRILDLIDTPSIYGADGQVLVMDGDNKLKWADEISPDMRFAALTDTPNEYTDQGGKMLAVNLTEDGVEFIEVPNSAVWGGITGTLSEQVDLQGALDSKAPVSHNHVEANITDLDKYTKDEVTALIAAAGGNLDDDIEPTINLGGITTDMSFASGTSITPLIQQLLSPYIAPSLTSIQIAPGSTVEVGTSVTVTSATLRWAEDSDGNTPAHVVITGEGFSGEQTLTSSPQVISAAASTVLNRTTPGNYAWTFAAKDKNNEVLTSKVDYISWLRRLYYGNSALETMTEVGVKALGSKLKTNAAGTYSYSAAAGQYKWFIINESEAQPNIFKDGATNLGIPFEAPQTVSITSNSVTMNMKCYRSTNKLGGAINIKIT